MENKYQVSKSLSKVWVEKQQLLLLLDGLDEVKTEHRNACVTALNQFIQTHGITEMVVCSRIRDYKMLSERLKLQSAICLQALTPKQIYQYLDQANNQLIALKTLLLQDTKLLNFAKSPLILSVMSLTYQGYSSEELFFLGSAEEWQKHLFDNYIKRMLQRRRVTQKHTKQKTMRWLIWLAKQLEHESQTEFLIEKMQPNLLKNKVDQLVFRLINGLNFWLILTLIIFFFSSFFLLITKLFPEISSYESSLYNPEYNFYKLLLIKNNKSFK